VISCHSGHTKDIVQTIIYTAIIMLAIIYLLDLIHHVCYTFGNGHGTGVTRYHSMMLLGGDELWFINHMPAHSPHQSPPDIYPSTTS